MIRYISVILICLFVISKAFATPSDREVLITKIEAEQTSFQLPAASPLSNLMFASIRNVNPQISDADWLSVKQELIDAQMKMLKSPGGPFDKMIRTALMNLSDSEMSDLVNILGTPAYQKYYTAILSSSVQTQFVQATVQSMPEIIASMNEILRKHKLHQIH